jgi:hypothetical protein
LERLWSVGVESADDEIIDRTWSFHWVGYGFCAWGVGRGRTTKFILLLYFVVEKRLDYFGKIQDRLSGLGEFEVRDTRASLATLHETMATVIGSSQ